MRDATGKIGASGGDLSRLRELLEEANAILRSILVLLDRFEEADAILRKIGHSQGGDMAEFGYWVGRVVDVYLKEHPEP